MFCRKCGKEIDDEAVVCHHCGCYAKETEKQEKYKAGSTSFDFLGLASIILSVLYFIITTRVYSVWVKIILGLLAFVPALLGFILLRKNKQLPILSLIGLGSSGYIMLNTIMSLFYLIF